MGYGFWDGVADVATGGAYSATKAGLGAAKDATEKVTGAVGGVTDALTTALGGTAGAIAGSVSGSISNIFSGKELKYCSYVIEGDYLLNSETGQVWLIDKGKKELLPIKRCKFALEGIANAVQLEAKKQFLLEQKDLEIGKLHHSIRNDFTNRVDKLIKALDKEIDENMKS